MEKCHHKVYVLADVVLHINIKNHACKCLHHLYAASTGLRIGKGEGYADMEYGMMASMGAVNESTVVVTVVHDCQVSQSSWLQSELSETLELINGKKKCLDVTQIHK